MSTSSKPTLIIQRKWGVWERQRVGERMRWQVLHLSLCWVVINEWDDNRGILSVTTSYFVSPGGEERGEQGISLRPGLVLGYGRSASKKSLVFDPHPFVPKQFCFSQLFLQAVEQRSVLCSYKRFSRTCSFCCFYWTWGQRTKLSLHSIDIAL